MPNEEQTEPTTPTPQPAPLLTPEQQQEQQERLERASAKIKQVLEEEKCVLTVPTLDISTGRVFPTIQLKAT